ncbi:Lrp/AsnC ligand binding domain-containing protein [Haladaptatus caseinilyticus]|uniref:Lrp/AsnC ligand binding domain-containing protein n=1 Tax=Haladaptatus caseinilyticus TaxID=2993314 RepID=UPI00224A8F62|nr:Lrp/AsnC ligand binding domain-containing protein [Haladaptatus caseinilyticus]
MIRAYTAIITGSGMSSDVVEAIRELQTVTEAHIVAGDFDIIAEIEADDQYEIQKTVTSGIGSIPGVGRTRTYVLLD